MPTFFIPIVEWLAEKILALIASYIDQAIISHRAAAKLAENGAEANAAALAKLAQAQSKQDRINAARDALQGL